MGSCGTFRWSEAAALPCTAELRAPVYITAADLPVDKGLPPPLLSAALERFAACGVVA